jgi:hypothetical protein
MKWLQSLFRRADYEAANAAIESAVRDKVSPDIAAIAERHGVSEKRTQELVETALGRLVRQRVADGVNAGQVPSQQIYDDVIGLGCPPDGAKRLLEEAVSDHFTELVLEILEDGQVEPTEDKRLDDFMAMIGQSVLSPNTKSAIDDGRKLYRACHGSLEPVDAPVLLKRGEFCVYVVTAEAFEDRSRTVRVNYHGPTARIPIMKGVSYRIGSIQPFRQTEEYQHSFGVGALCMTNQRLLWVSPKKSISVQLSNIVRFDPFTDGLRIFKGSGKPLLFVWQDQDRVATLMA